MELGIEPLNPELLSYLRQDPVLGEVLKHPLVYSVPYHAMLAKWTNAMLAQKTVAIEEASRKQDWHRVVFLHERPWRIDAFSRHASQMTDEQYWSLLGQIYTDSENVAENFELWGAMLCAARPQREAMMAEQEHAVLKALPAEVEVFRGDIRRTPSDYSWTLDRDVAHWFAERTARMENRRCALVLTGRLCKEDVLAYKDNRSEKEIIALPQHVRVTAQDPVALR